MITNVRKLSHLFGHHTYGMWLAILLALAASVSMPARAANACRDDELQGPYGLQLVGTTTISPVETPTATLARIVFDNGSVSGNSSVNFNGLLLGNPVTGTYAIKPDCTMSLSLQDDSGAFQHFSGVVTPGGNRVEVRQTDPGTGGRGLMRRTADACTITDICEKYTLTLSGVYTPLAPDGVSGTIAANVMIDMDAKGSFKLTRRVMLIGNSTDITTTGTYEVDADCIVRLEITLPGGNGEAPIPMKLRGILVNGGQEILAIQTDPAAVVSGRFTAR